MQPLPDWISPGWILFEGIGSQEAAGRGVERGGRKVLCCKRNICVQPPRCGQNETEMDDATRMQHGREESNTREKKAGLQDRLREGCVFVLFLVIEGKRAWMVFYHPSPGCCTFM